MSSDAPSVNIYTMKRNEDMYRVNRVEFIVPVLEASNPSWVLVRFKNIALDTEFMTDRLAFPMKGLVLKPEVARTLWQEMTTKGWRSDNSTLCSRLLKEIDLPQDLSFGGLSVLSKIYSH